MTRIINTFIFLILIIGSIQGAKGYEINVKIDGFTGEELYLGYHYADKQYLRDTATINTKDGYFTFSGEETLPCGLYLVVLPPDNNMFQLVISEGDQRFTVDTKIDDLSGAVVVKKSKENQQFYEYLHFLGSLRPEAEALNKERKTLEEGDPKIADIDGKLEGFNQKVEDYQRTFVEKNKGMLVADIIHASMDIDMPETITDKTQQYVYVKTHWFDNVNLDNECMLRTSSILNKVTYYIEKLTPQHPDSIIQSVDYLLERTKGNEEIFKYVLVTMINKYAASKIVGMDKVYVHIVEEYYAKGLAPWTEEEQLEKILGDGLALKPLLIGKIAPEIAVPELDVDGTIAAKDNESEHKRFKVKDKVSLHGVEAPFTMLFMWSPDCGHCKKSMPTIIEFYDKYKDKGLKMYAICHRNYKETVSCAEFIKERPGMFEWINVNDPYFRSKYHSIYNVKSTPQIYILGEDKEILSKKIGAEQLGDVMDMLIEMRQKELEEKETND